MMKRIIITMAIFATMTLTGCSLNNELSPFIPVEAAGNKSSMTSTVSEVEEPTTSTSEVENESSINNEAVASTTSITESKPEEKPVESSSTSTIEKPVESTSTTTEKPVASTTTSSKVEKPVASSTTSSAKPVASSSSTTSKVEKPVASSSTSSTTSKPVEKPVASSSSTSTTTSKPVEKPVEKVHDCSIDGHVWEVTTITTEPKWCREMHDVIDNGYDVTLASRYLGVDGGKAYEIFLNNMEAIGVMGNAGSATIDVEVWGTETYETKVCTICGHIVNASDKGTINPIGEWQYINGVNPRCGDPRLNFNTLFYDPYNVPQVVIDNINLEWELMWG